MTSHFDPNQVELTGFIDMHTHTAPDVGPRLLDDIVAARQAADAGMQAIVFKSHVTCTADRAAIARKVVPTVDVFGGVTLNHAVGALNPAAVEAALQLGARVVWMPTISARNHMIRHGLPGSGIGILSDDGRPASSLHEIFALLVQYDAILATGHLSVDEIVMLVQEAKNARVRKVLVTHPELPWVDVPTEVQLQLRGYGAYFERCYASTLPETGAVDIGRIVADIRKVGVETTAIATDLGATGLPAPVDGMRIFVASLFSHGFSEREIRRMAADVPAMLLGLV
jgi:hypothetical protein